MGDHEAGIDAAMLGEEWRQEPLSAESISNAIRRSASAPISEMASAERVMAAERDRLGVEIAAGKQNLPFSEYQQDCRLRHWLRS